MRRIAAVILIACAVGGVFVATGANKNDSGGGGKVFKIAFDNAFGLTQGGDIRVGGVNAGQTTGFDLSRGKECQGATPSDGPPRACAIVTAEITEPGFGSMRSDAHCDIRQQSLIGEYYVDCQPGTAKQTLPNNATIPDTRTTSTIPADLVGDVMRQPYRERLRLIIAELGTGLAGRPQDVSELLHKAHPGLRETDKVLNILGNQDTIIKNFIADSNTVVRQLDLRKNDLKRWIVEAGQASELSASRRQALAAGFQRLPTFLDELNGTMARLEDLTDAQTPLLRELHTAAPDLNEFFTRLGPFSQASLPAFQSLGRASDAGRKAFNDSTQEIATLNQLAKPAPAAAKPLRQFFQTLDTRDRATEPDPLQAQTAPPPPDPTAARKNGGLTGFESLLSYVFWQTTAINIYDSIGHVLRGVAIADHECSNFQNEKDVPAKCRNWLGPRQPGINAPDVGKNGTQPTFGQFSANASSSKAKTGQPGGPEAPPIPGQPDYSRPHPTLPPSQQELLNQLTGAAPTGGQSTQTQPQAPPADAVSGVLNYLLSP